MNSSRRADPPLGPRPQTLVPHTKETTPFAPANRRKWELLKNRPGRVHMMEGWPEGAPWVRCRDVYLPAARGANGVGQIKRHWLTKTARIVAYAYLDKDKHDPSGYSYHWYRVWHTFDRDADAYGRYMPCEGVTLEDFEAERETGTPLDHSRAA